MQQCKDCKMTWNGAYFSALFIFVVFTWMQCFGYTVTGKWGEWEEVPRCNQCLGIRYKYNCSFIPDTSWNKTLISHEVCSQNLYYQRINKVSNGCFSLGVEGSAMDESLDYGYNQEYEIEDTVSKIKAQGDWHSGEKGWGRCILLRKFRGKKTNIFNRRGRQKRLYTCPTDGTTVWREEWRHCCAGYWTEWRILEDCPDCGWGVRRSVRICAVPTMSLNVKMLAHQTEFLSQWQVRECRRHHCKMVGEEVKSCKEVCEMDDWWEGTLCKKLGRQAYAGECCIKGQRDVRSTCGMEERTLSESEQYRTTTMVTVILGAEALLIVIVAIIVVLYNIGKVPDALSKAFRTCYCGKPGKSMKYRPTTRRLMREASAKGRPNGQKKKLRVAARNVQELNRFFESSATRESTTDQTTAEV